MLTRRETPGFLKTDQASRWLGIMTLMLDLSVELLLRARATQWPLHPNCPDDALALIGRDRMLPQYPDETRVNYGPRLVDAWNIWARAGDEEQLKDSLEDWGFTVDKVHIISNADWGVRDDFTDPGNPLPAWASPAQDDQAAMWARFWVYVEVGGHAFTKANEFDGGTVFDDGAVFDTGSITRQQVVSLHQLIENFRAGHELAVNIRFLLDASAGFTAPDVFSGDSVSLNLQDM